MKLKVLSLLVFCCLYLRALAQKSPEFTAWSRMVMHSMRPYVQIASKDGAISSSVAKKYGIFRGPQGQYFARAIILSHQPDTQELQKYQIEIARIKDHIYTASIPLSSFHALPLLQSVSLIDFGKKVNKRLDKALKASKADWVHNGTAPLSKPYLGTGVCVGVIDYGFDFTHPMFADINGDPLILSCWNQNGFGKRPAGFNYGEEISGSANLLNAVSSTSDESHGTHVLGIAAGNGNGSNGQFVGFAPEATPILVDLRNTDADLLDAIKYIFNKADKVSKPAVINMSLGSHIGPHDGTSLTDQGIDKLSGPGHIICGAAGNEADMMLHAKHTFNNDTFRTFLIFEDNFDQTGSGTVDIWADAASPLSIAITWFDENNRKEILRTPFYMSNKDGAGDTLIIWKGDSLLISWAASQKYSGNGKSNIIFDIQNLSAHYTGLLVYKSSGEMHMWNDGQGSGADFTNVVGTSKVSGYSTGDNNTTCGEIGGTSHQIITVGSYTTKTSYINLKKNTIDLSSYATLNDLALYSSRGPTADGRTKPDLTAPGLVVVSAVSSDDIYYDATSDEVVYKTTFGGVDYFYAAFEGTSMATPCVTGAVALLLQSKPNLNPDQVKNILAMSALTDSYTGNIGAAGSNLWGYGKLNLYEAMKKVEQFNGVTYTENVAPGISIFPNPAQNQIFIRNLNGTDKTFHIRMTNVSGSQVWAINNLNIQNIYTLPLDQLSAGIYFLSLSDSAGNIYIQKILVQP